MVIRLKAQLKRILQSLGIVIVKTDKFTYGYNLDEDIRRIYRLTNNGRNNLVIFDIGSNIGQSIFKYKMLFPNSEIHAFEPSLKTFELLYKATSKLNGIKYNNVGVGSKVSREIFIDNEFSDVSSFLEPTSKIWGEAISRDLVDITTVDQYIIENELKHIDLLKIDTQGFDFEVLKGAMQTMIEGRITLIQLEITLTEFYAGLPRMDDIIKFLLDKGYRLVAFYNFHNRNIAAQWTDCLWIHESFTLIPLNKLTKKLEEQE